MKYQRLLSHHNFIKMFIADIVNRFGDALDAIALSILTYSMTNSASLSALAFAVNKIPTILFQPIFGAYVERCKKQKIMMISDCIRCMLVGYIAIRLFNHQLHIIELFLCTFLISTVEALRRPASIAFIPYLLDDQDLELGLSMNESFTYMIDLIGTAMAGVFITMFSIVLVILIDMATFVISALLIASIHVHEVNQMNHKNIFLDMMEGLRLVFSHLSLKWLIFLSVFLNAIITPLNALEVPFVKEVLYSSETTISVISATLTLGTIIGSLIYPYICQIFKAKTMMIILVCLLSSIYIIPCIISHYFENDIIKFIIICMFFIMFGFSLSFVNIYSHVRLMRLVSKDYLARVNAFVFAACSCMTPMASFLLSIYGRFVSTKMIFVGCGIVNLIIFFMFFFSRLDVMYDE